DYLISLASGDASWPQGPHRVVVEGIVAIDNVPTAANRFVQVTDLLVTVADGRLSVDIGGAGGKYDVELPRHHLCWVRTAWTAPATSPLHADHVRGAGQELREHPGRLRRHPELRQLCRAPDLRRRRRCERVRRRHGLGKVHDQLSRDGKSAI